MSFAVGPITSLPEPVAAHDTEFKYLSVRRYADDAELHFSATADESADTAVTQEAVDAGSLSALAAFAPLRPAEFVIIRFTQAMGPTEDRGG